MHYVNDFEPYLSAADGTKDLFGLIARPTSKFKSEELLPIFYERIEKKQWKEKWPKLRVEVE